MVERINKLHKYGQLIVQLAELTIDSSQLEIYENQKVALPLNSSPDLRILF